MQLSISALDISFLRFNAVLLMVELLCFKYWITSKIHLWFRSVYFNKKQEIAVIPREA